jgi:hypothetical protein
VQDHVDREDTGFGAKQGGKGEKENAQSHRDSLALRAVARPGVARQAKRPAPQNAGTSFWDKMLAERAGAKSGLLARVDPGVDL